MQGDAGACIQCSKQANAVVLQAWEPSVRGQCVV